MEEPLVPALSSIQPKSKTTLVGTQVQAFEECFNFEMSENGQECFAVAGLKGAWYIDNLLTLEECSRLCQTIDNNDNLSFWSGTGREDEAARSFRNADTIEVNSLRISDILWQRAVNHLPLLEMSVLIPVEEEDEVSSLDIEMNNAASKSKSGETQHQADQGCLESGRWQRDIIGEWSPSQLNEDFLFARYPSQGSFSPHTDGSAIVDFNTRSFFSVVLFLNTVSADCGAGTRFYRPEACQHLVQRQQQQQEQQAEEEEEEEKARGNVENGAPTGREGGRGGGDGGQWTASLSLRVGEVAAVAGRMLVFDQRYVHEGVPPLTPHTKHIIRSDVMFRRSPALLTEEVHRVAWGLHREAEVAAEEGRVKEAVALFRRAYKMSPALAQVLGQA